jgi:RimJ/RimL family protein N-acetyltransferase
VLETERLLLRLPVPEDAEHLFEAFSDPEVMRFIGRGEIADRVQTAEQIDRMLRAWRVDGFGRFAVVRREDGVVLGRVGLLVWDSATWKSGLRSEIGDRAELELGWTLARHAWGHGYATEAAEAVRDWALREVRPPRLVSLIHPDNERSQRVAAKLGERYERTVMTHRGVAAELWAM